MKKIINMEKTAINTGIAFATKLLKKELVDVENSSILDYGFGKGRNSVFLKENFVIDGLETQEQILNTKKEIKNIYNKILVSTDELKNKYDGILLTYVLNVIPDKETRIEIVKKTYNALSYKGKLFIQVRGTKSLKNVKYKEAYKDGFLVGKNKIKTFQKEYSRKNLEELLINQGIFNFNIIKKGDSLIAVVAKENFGQMSIKNISNKANYLQLDICNLSKKEALEKYNNYNKEIPIILHGDWTKKGASEDNLDNRHSEYINIIKALKEKTLVLGITIHPPKKSRMSENELISYMSKISKETNVSVFLENRSNNKYIISTPEEVINFSKKHLMTIDIPQLYIACQFNEVIFKNTLDNINWENIKELHVGGLVRKLKSEGAKRNMTLVAQQLTKGILDYKLYMKYFKKVPYKTFEILGSHNTFNEQVNIYKKWGCESYE